MVDLRRPKTVEDNIPVVAANTWPIPQSVVWCGEGDDVANGVVGSGQEFRLQKAEAGDEIVESQFIEVTRLGGGHVYWKNCEYGDYACFLVYAPATSNIVSNPGAGAYAKLPIGGGANLIVMPGVPGSDGPNWDIDLTEKLNANVDFTKAVPVPAANGDGFFTYDAEAKVLSYTPGVGTYNLFDVPISLSKFIRKLWLINSSSMSLSVYDNIPAAILPQWRSKVTLHRESASGETRYLVWSMLISRLKTV
jgi:hypothetical protein